MPSFIDILNESAVTYVRDLNALGYTSISGPGWEAISPTGEIRVFGTRYEAEKWRMAEVNACAKVGA